jgi:hypothetical protein
MKKNVKNMKKYFYLELQIKYLHIFTYIYVNGSNNI